MLKQSLKSKDYEKYAIYFLEKLEKKAPYAYVQATHCLLNYGKRKSTFTEVNNFYLNAVKDDSELEDIYRMMIGVERQNSEKEAKLFNFEKLIENIFVMIHIKNPELLAQLEKLDISDRMRKNFTSPQEIVDSVICEIMKIDGVDPKEWQKNLLEAAGLEEQDIVEKKNSITFEEDKTEEAPRDETINNDEKLFRTLKNKLSENELAIFSKIFILFSKNIIGYYEFYILTENFLIKAGKEWCIEIKKEIDAREHSRSNNNFFNIKNVIKNIESPLNKSYKRIEKGLKFITNSKSLINKEYMGIAQGTESQGNGDEIKKVLKIQQEISLLSVEDQMYEVDLTLLQMRFVVNTLKKIENLNPDSPLLEKLIVKITNLGVLQLIFGGRSLEFLKTLLNKPEVATFLSYHIQKKIDKIQNISSDRLSQEWLRVMGDNYYKSLDLRSNFIKICEKRAIHPKTLIQELKNQTFESNKVFLLNSFNNFLYSECELLDFVSLYPNENKNNPAFALKLNDGKVFGDLIFFLNIFIKFKVQNSERDKVIATIDKIIENFFPISSLMDRKKLIKNSNTFIEVSDLFVKVTELEHLLYPNKLFYFSAKTKIEINSEKVNDVEAKIKEVCNLCIRKKSIELMDQKNIEKIFNDIIDVKNDEYNGEIILANAASKNSSRSFFGTQNCYLAYRYFAMIYSKFEYIKKLSFEKLGSEYLYDIFKKILLYNIVDIIDNQKYEDLMRMLFDLKAGVFFSIDKIFLSFCKNQLDELSNFSFNMSSTTFDGLSNFSEPEESIFAKVCYKQLDLQNVSQKVSKANNSISSKILNAEICEILKFEYIIKDDLFLIYRLKSIFPTSLNTLKDFLEKNNHLMMFKIKSELSINENNNVICRYRLPIAFINKYQKSGPIFSNTEDVILNQVREDHDLLERRRVEKEKRRQKFYDMIKTDKSRKFD